MAHHEYVTHPLVLRQVTVARATNVTPRMRRVTLTGPQLRAFTRDGFALPAFASDTFDDHVKLVFAADGDIAAALPVQRARSIDWPPSTQRQGRDYTPRRWDPDTAELDLDFVLHGDGPAASWATAARPGDVLHFAGPKSSLVLPETIDWVMLAGDETALPAIGRYLDQRPRDVPVQVIVEVRDEAARQDLPTRDGDTVRWVVTPPHAPSVIARAACEADWWPGQPYVWAAGESGSLIALRRWLKRDKEIPASHINVTGYWHAPIKDDSADTTADPETLLHPLPWLAARAAFALGMWDVVGDNALSVTEIAARLDIDPEACEVLTSYLITLDLLATKDGGVAIGPVAEKLLDDDHVREELFGGGIESRTLEALLRLAPAMRHAEPAWQHYFGQSLAREIGAVPTTFADRSARAESFSFVARGVLDTPAWKESRRVIVTGPGAVTLARALSDQTGTDIVLTGTPETLPVLRQASTGHDVVPLTSIATAETIISALESSYRTDDELRAHLRDLAPATERVLLIDALGRTGPGAGEIAAEHNLLAMAENGRAPRGYDDIATVAADAGWDVVHHTKLGWDFETFELRSR